MNRVTVTIAEREMTLLTDGEADFTRRVAQRVDSELSALLEGGKVSMADACILSAMNLAEELFKEQESSENLRRQLKEYLEESSKLKLELSEAKREIFKLGTKK